MTERLIRNYVGGRFIDPDDGASIWDKTSPVDNSVVARVHEADEQLVGRAVSEGRAALDGPWGRTSVTERVALLRRIADAIEARAEEFAVAESRDTGKPLVQTRELDVRRAIQNFRVFADVIAAAGQESFMTDLPGGRQALNYVVRQRLGVVGVIVPWNLPLLLLTWKVAPALGCGNTVVVKPSDETPSSATLLAEIFDEVEAPAGIYNVVHGFGASSAGAHLVGHPDIDAITFTGSTATGSAIMSTVAPKVKPISFELGGKNAAIVFSDADLDLTLDGLARSTFSNTGQVCLCTERIYVHRSVFDDVANGLAHRAQQLVLGDPDDPKTTTGPLISHQHRAKVMRYFELADSCGATKLAGGAVPLLGGTFDKGSWIEPTVWTGMDNQAAPMREEVFGPVAGLIPFDTEEEAIVLANDTPYGLAASTWTTDLARAHRVAQQMRVGMSWINTWFLRDLRSPFGGVGLSGIGREGGAHSIDFYTESTNVCMTL